MSRPPVDLHTHSTASDGGLSPTELVQAAAARGVRCLALTDHDTCAGVAEARAAAQEAGIQLVSGIELSSVWEGRGVHVVGLDIDIDHPAIKDAEAHQRTAREIRAEEIAVRLEKRGAAGVMPLARKHAGPALVGRPHFARALVELGVVESEGEAFKRYLGAGKVGDIRAHWPEMATVIRWIKDGGGIAVLAHPGKYDLSWTKLRRLVSEFVTAGGEAIEVSYGGENPERIRELGRMANKQQLLASVGSDYHRPEYHWTDLGKFPPLPEPVTGVWERWI
ncbi:PHP domain-containing protein [Motiliproteus sediminis]|uniref:PHP domain-containing protein n=1 Tax=Motiliproteus sediminis TaxID=1468178 RepID=UPI001AF00BBB|nr:PHP domain-containing protein [Motiliproteus sediminis]